MKKDICKSCGKSIQFTGEYWEHIEASARHPAMPLSEHKKEDMKNIREIPIEDLEKEIERRKEECNPRPLMLNEKRYELFVLQCEDLMNEYKIKGITKTQETIFMRTP